METKRLYQFRKAQKIKRKAEISGLFKSGKKWNCEWCSVYSSENSINRNRCVIVVPKAIGSAVQRNKTKRSVREYFRYFLKNTPLHIDVLVKIHPAKEMNKSKYRLEEALSLWLETVK